MATDGGQTANYELTLSFRYQLRIIYGRYTVDTRLIHGTLVYTHRSLYHFLYLTNYLSIT